MFLKILKIQDIPHIMRVFFNLPEILCIFPMKFRVILGLNIVKGKFYQSFHKLIYQHLVFKFKKMSINKGENFNFPFIE